ncbi:hypothetical protein Tco_0726780 [Tanacetum coccineum]|uniref:Transposase n=1 Tax=Tanacetum coccineum TaxID=301880 RepID=A0ABQ4YGJ7_9ASTR
METRQMRLSFKIDKVLEPNNRVLDVDNYNIHGDVEEIEKTANDSDDESIPEFMDEDDNHGEGFGSGNSTESEGSVFEREEFQPIKKVAKYYFKEPNDPRDTHFKVGQIALNGLVGDMVEHYAKLSDYKEELETTNPSLIIELSYVVSSQGGLRSCIDLEMIDGGKGWTLLTDQQKGLVPDITELLPNAEHRMCARHVFSNWHKVFKGERTPQAQNDHKREWNMETNVQNLGPKSICTRSESIPLKNTIECKSLPI